MLNRQKDKYQDTQCIPEHNQQALAFIFLLESRQLVHYTSLYAQTHRIQWYRKLSNAFLFPLNNKSRLQLSGVILNKYLEHCQNDII